MNITMFRSSCKQPPPKLPNREGRMPSKDAQYDLVSDDGYDSRPFYTEEDFKIGIQFQAKLVGKMDVSRPNNRGEIVAAMRRIRYEFKAKSAKKCRVILSISVDGVTVFTRKRKTTFQFWKETRSVLYQHPIHRVFYVSHDSQDLNIFSYIARDTTTNMFICVVFKSYRKSQAIGIVGTIGQAFEVCHKLNQDRDKTSTIYQRSDESSAIDTKLDSGDSETYRYTSGDSENPYFGGSESQNSAHFSVLKKIEEVNSDVDDLAYAKRTPDRASHSTGGQPLSGGGTPLLTEAKVHQSHQHHQATGIVMAQIQLLKEQLSLETAARIEAQARTNQMVAQNKQLQDYLHILVSRVRELESCQNNLENKRVTNASPAKLIFSSPLKSKGTNISSTFSRIYSNKSPLLQDVYPSNKSNGKDPNSGTNVSPFLSNYNSFLPHQETFNSSSPDEDIFPVPPMFQNKTSSTPPHFQQQQPTSLVSSHQFHSKPVTSIQDASIGINQSITNVITNPHDNHQQPMSESPDSGLREMSSDSLSQVMFWSSIGAANPSNPDKSTSNSQLFSSHPAMSWAPNLTSTLIMQSSSSNASSNGATTTITPTTSSTTVPTPPKNLFSSPKFGHNENLSINAFHQINQQFGNINTNHQYQQQQQQLRGHLSFSPEPLPAPFSSNTNGSSALHQQQISMSSSTSHDTLPPRLNPPPEVASRRGGTKRRDRGSGGGMGVSSGSNSTTSSSSAYQLSAACRLASGGNRISQAMTRSVSGECGHRSSCTEEDESGANLTDENANPESQDEMSQQCRGSSISMVPSRGGITN